MILSTSKIKQHLSKRYPSIAYLETGDKTTGRYKDKDIILFEYTNAAGEAVVLKFFSLQKLEESEKQQEKQNLLMEYQIIRRFGTHRNIVRVYDANELDHDGTLIGFYITMEKFNWTLSQLLDQKEQFSDDQVEEFLRQMDDVLQTAHYKLPEPVVHSDIKPANIGVRETAGGYEYALMDFDVSVALERAGEDTASFTLSNKASMKGLSPAYAPPEQVMAYLHKTGSISNRVDVYAVGAIAMQMLTGIPPKKDEQKIYYSLPFGSIPDRKWQDLFQKLCHPNPKHRAKRISEEFEKVKSNNYVNEKELESIIQQKAEEESTIKVDSNTTSKGDDTVKFNSYQSKVPNQTRSKEQKFIYSKWLYVSVAVFILFLVLYFQINEKESFNELLIEDTTIPPEILLEQEKRNELDKKESNTKSAVDIEGKGYESEKSYRSDVSSGDNEWQRDASTEIVDVTNPATGKTWMDRNLGASRAATTSTDSEAYGDLYQWGRAADGHEKRFSGTTSTLSSADTPGHGNFILAPNSPYDWRTPQSDKLWQGVNGVNNPCPIGYRLPTEAELNAERQSWSSNNTSGALASPLKLPLSNSRTSYGSISTDGSIGYRWSIQSSYWSSTVDGFFAYGLNFAFDGAYMSKTQRNLGFSVRCIKD